MNLEIVRLLFELVNNMLESIGIVGLVGRFLVIYDIVLVKDFCSK